MQAQPPPVLPLVLKGKAKAIAKETETEKAQKVHDKEELKKQKTAVKRNTISIKRVVLAK